MYNFSLSKKSRFIYNIIQPKSIYIIILTTTLLTSVGFLWFSFFPGANFSNALRYFDENAIMFGREYAQGQRILYILRFLIQFFFLTWVLSSHRVKSLMSVYFKSKHNGNKCKLIIGILWILIILKVLTLPFDFFGSYIWQHSWGFSTQDQTSWWNDYLKTLVIDLGFTLIAMVFVIAILNQWKRTWWLIGTLFMSAWLIIETALWPVLIAPLYNNFYTETDKDVIIMVQDISSKADLEINQVLVMDASQRTVKANAYFAGFGSTKRIVLYDNLKENYPLNEIQAVIAHEIAHWKKGHIVKGLTLGIIGSIVLWRVLYFLLNKEKSYQKNSVLTSVMILWFFMSISFISSPIQNYISRGMETEADRYAVELTRDIDSAIKLQIDIASKNLSDVSPPAFIEWFSYSHPSALRRIETLTRLKLD